MTKACLYINNLNSLTAIPLLVAFLKDLYVTSLTIPQKKRHFPSPYNLGLCYTDTKLQQVVTDYVLIYFTCRIIFLPYEICHGIETVHELFKPFFMLILCGYLQVVTGFSSFPYMR